MEIINPKLPEGARVIEAKEVERFATAVDICAQWAEYRIKPYAKSDVSIDFEEFKTHDIRRLDLPSRLKLSLDGNYFERIFEEKNKIHKKINVISNENYQMISNTEGESFSKYKNKAYSK